MGNAPTMSLPTVPFNSPSWWIARFNAVHPITAKWEGGEVNDKYDPGGHTKYGVTQANYTKWLKDQGRANQSVSLLTKEESLRIYDDNYFEPTAVKYKLVPGVDLSVYDAGVNSGPARAIKWLMSSASKTNDHVATVKAFNKTRRSFVNSLKTFWRFGKGWMNRIADVEAKSIAMAAMYMSGSATAAQNELVKEANAAEKERKSSTTKATQTGAGATGATATGTVNDTPVTATPDVSHEWVTYALYGLAAVLAIAVVYFLVRTYVAKVRRDALKREIGNVG